VFCIESTGGHYSVLKTTRDSKSKTVNFSHSGGTKPSHDNLRQYLYSAR